MVFAMLATLIPSLGLGLLSFRQNEMQTSENLTRQLHALTGYASREIGLWRDRRVHEAHVTATSSAVIDTIGTNYPTPHTVTGERPPRTGSLPEFGNAKARYHTRVDSSGCGRANGGKQRAKRRCGGAPDQLAR